MPYITQEERDKLDTGGGVPTNAGQLNYLITKLCMQYTYGSNQKDGKIIPNYERFNAVIGVLECAKLEVYRRRVGPYEDYKLTLNGDVGIVERNQSNE